MIRHGVRLLVLWLGRCGGWLAYHAFVRRRRVALANIKAALGEQLSAAERRRAVRESFENIGLNAAELLLTPMFDPAYISRVARVQNAELIQRLVREKRPLVFLSAHFGNWELCASFGARLLHLHMHTLAREQKPAFLNRFLNQCRQSLGVRIVEKGMALRQMIRVLRQQGTIGILGDQSGRQGVLLDFFGREVYFADGAFRLAAATGAVVVPVFNVRQGTRHTLQIEAPIFDAAQQSDPAAQARGLRAYRDVLQRYIRRYPGLWLWPHKRWKHTRSRRILLLDDGRAGHLRQAQAVAAMIKEELPSATVNTVPIRYRHAAGRCVLTLVALCCGRSRLAEPWPVLRWCLAPASARACEQTFGDIIISTGSGTRAPALLLANEHLAKTVSIMRPRPFSARRFSLIIAPRHDQLASAPNIVSTRGALYHMSRESLLCQRRQLEAMAPRRRESRVGLLIGGSSRAYYYPPGEFAAFMEQVTDVADRHNADIVFSTSRRTEHALCARLHAAFDRHPACALAIYAAEHNYDFAVGGILAASDCVLVSGESISLVSEAVGSGALTLVFTPRPRGLQAAKHERFLQEMATGGYIVRVNRQDVAEWLQRALAGGIIRQYSHDMSAVRAALRRIL